MQLVTGYVLLGEPSFHFQRNAEVFLHPLLFETCPVILFDVEAVITFEMWRHQ